MVDPEMTLKGLHDAKCLIEDRIPQRYRGRALYALGEVMEMLTPAEAEIEGGGSSWWHVCPECRGAVDSQDHFCRCCGKALKKDDR